MADDRVCRLRPAQDAAATGSLAWMFAVAVAAGVLPGCAGGGTPAPPSSGVVLGAAVAYIGTTDACVSPSNCVRAPATDGNFVTLSQTGNASDFQVTSADASIAYGTVVMRGPAAQGDPAVALVGHKAGSTTLTITGANGATAALPITITTVAALTLQLDGLPAAKYVTFTVSAPPNTPCPGFQGGYSFQWGPLASNTLTLRNFPAMGAGPSSQCVFSSIEVAVSDASNNALADKTFQRPITVGQDNSTTLVVP